MALTSLLWNVVVGFLFGWISSTLVEWVWFRGRRRRMEMASVPSGMRASQLMAGGSSAETEGDQELPPEREAPPPVAKGERRQTEKPARGRTKRAAKQALANRPDNLTAVHGIGDLYERRLYQVGIFTWHQLSRMDAETLQQITKALPSSNPQGWIDQARELAMANERVGAVYDGPLPEDLTRIDGIDQVYEDELYAAGVLTFRQLAERAPDELARIIPAHLVGDQLDFDSWIAQADYLRDEYYPDEPPIL
jgi:predicted flap endonuclease-1-like 5' DNA nuclease